MDKISSSLTFSAVTAKITTDFDELMRCDDLLDDEEVSCLCSEERYSSSWCSFSEDSRTTSTCSSCWCTMSEDGRVTDATSCCSMNEDGRLTDCSSWCSSSDSDTSEVITSLDQNLDEEITKVCERFLFPENLETEVEDFGEEDEVCTPEPGSSPRHGIRSEEGSRPASSASSFSQVATEPAKTLVATEPVKTLVATEPVKTLVATEPAKTLVATEPVKTLVATEPVKSCHDAPPQSDPSSSPVVEEQDVPPEETGNTLPSSPSISSFPPAHQVDVIPRSQSQLWTGTATDELRNSPSHQSRDSADGVLKDVPQGPSEEDGDPQKAKEAAADWQLVLNWSHITTIIRTFFQSLGEE